MGFVWWFLEDECLSFVVFNPPLATVKNLAFWWNLSEYLSGGVCARLVMIWGSPNMGPQIIHFNRIFHYKPSILGILHMWMGQNGNFRLSSGFIYHGSSSWQNGSRSYFESQHDRTEILGAGCEMTHIHVLKMVQDGCGHNLWFGDCRCWNMLMILLVERGHTKSYESGISGSCMVQILEAELHCITHGSNEIANYDAFLLFITNYYSLLEYTHLNLQSNRFISTVFAQSLHGAHLLATICCVWLQKQCRGGVKWCQMLILLKSMPRYTLWLFNIAMESMVHL